MKTNLWIIVLSCVCAQCLSYNILCLLPYPGKSHHMVFEPLLQELAARGHRLTVVSFFPSSKPHPNRRDVSLVGLAPLNIEVVDISEFDNSNFGYARYIQHVTVVTQLARSTLELCEKLLDAEVFREFVDAKGDFDVIMVEHFISDCMLGLIHNYGLPSVGLMSCAMLPYSYYRVGVSDNPSYVPVMTLPFTDKMSFIERVENTVIQYFYVLWYEVAIRWKEQIILERKLGRRLPILEDIGKNASVVLVNAHHSLNGARELPPSVIEVGGLHLHNRTVQPLPPDFKELVFQAKDGFILFSLGSLVKGSTMPVKRLRAILKVFARLPQIVFWKWESDDDIQLPKNVRIFKWLPQYDLLNHPNCVAFVSHAGMLSLTEAVSAGVPTLAVPILGDQFGNAAHAQRAGIAEVVTLWDLDEDTFDAALRNVLFGKMKARAKQLSEIWHDKPMKPMDRAVFYVEKTARHRGLDLSTQGRWLSRPQLALLDIIALVVVSMIIFIFGVICLCRGLKKKFD